MATTKRGPVKGSAGTEFKRDDVVVVEDRKGRITGFSRDGRAVYVRFDAKVEGKAIAGKFSRHDVLAS